MIFGSGVVPLVEAVPDLFFRGEPVELGYMWRDLAIPKNLTRNTSCFVVWISINQSISARTLDRLLVEVSVLYLLPHTCGYAPDRPSKILLVRVPGGDPVLPIPRLAS